MQNWTKCHLKRPGPTRRSSVKDVLVLFCYIFTSRLFLKVGYLIQFLNMAAHKSVRFDKKQRNFLGKINQDKLIHIFIYIYVYLLFNFTL